MAVAWSSTFQRLATTRERAGVHEATGEPDQPFAANLASQRGFARAEHDQIGVQPERVDVVQPQEPVLRLTLGIVQREHEPRELRMRVVQQAVRREVDDGIAG